MNQKITLIIPEHAPRDIVAILHEIDTATKARTKLLADSAGRDMTRDEAELWLRLFHDLRALQREFCAELHQMTGLTCSRIINAVDSAL